MNERREQIVLVGATLGTLLALLLGWNALATRFDTDARTMRRTDEVWDRAGRDLARTLATLPAPAHPRVVVYGSSQIAVVKGEAEGSLAATPHRLAQALAARGISAEIVDFSDGGQQLVESAVVHFAAGTTSRPAAVVVGVGLFSLRDTEIRATLLEGVEETPVAEALRAALPPDADPAAATTLLGWSGSSGEAATVDGETIQQRMDRRIDQWLDRHVAAYANRKTMYREAIDLPIRLALERRDRERQGRTISSSYAIGKGYAPSLLALETIARSMAAIGVPVLVIVLPFDSARPPIPYDAATQARIVSDLRAIAKRNGAYILDLGDALDTGNFADYEDGSPDNLHYDAAGHALVAERVAEALAELLREPR